MADHHRWSYSKVFKESLAHYSKDEQEKVIDFIVTYQDHGLSDFTKFPGKIARSGSGNCSEELRQYCNDNHLWHYHVGVPFFVQKHGKYMTSRDVLHFQWFKEENRIRLVDMYRHYLMNGNFYVPSERLLLPENPEQIHGAPLAENDDAGDVPKAV